MVENFINSDDVSKYLKAMFPVSKLSPFFVTNRFGGEIFIVGECDDTPDTEWSGDLDLSQFSVGMVKDIHELAATIIEPVQRALGDYKLMTIVPMRYFMFNMINRPNNHKIGGLVARPVRRTGECGEGGFPDIAFIREDTVNSGVIAHELGHTLEQCKEFCD